MSKHTPGPWIAPKDQVNMVCRKSDYECPQVGALANGFQAIVSLKQGEAQAIADARLIAAAPEMLEVLKQLVETAYAALPKNHVGEGQWIDTFGSCGMDQIVREAEVAIAKAEGRGE